MYTNSLNFQTCTNLTCILAGGLLFEALLDLFYWLLFMC